MKHNRVRKTFAVCVKNGGYEVSLDLRKLYPVLPDAKAARHGFVRVIDESGEDYLYPADFFVPVEIPERLKKSLKLAIEPVA